MKTWRKVYLREVLFLDLDKVSIDAGTEYQMVGVYSFGRGLFDREPIQGINTSYKYFNRLKSEHIVMSQLFGWEGALALSSSKFEGKYLSPQFPTFMVDYKKMNRNYLGWYMKRPAFWEELKRRARGMGDRRRTLNPEALLTIEIPLPSLSEQNRIVKKIDNLSVKSNELKLLRNNSITAVESLIDSTLIKLIEKRDGYIKWKNKILSQLAEINPRRPNINLKPDDLVTFVPMSAVDEKTGTIVSAQQRPYKEVNKGYTYFQEEDVLFARITPCMENGKSVVAQKLSNGIGFGTTEFHVIRTGKELDAHYLHAIIRSREFRQDAHDHFKGTAGQQRVPASFLVNKTIPYPPIEEQRRIVKFLNRLQISVDQLKTLQSQSVIEIEALIPSLLEKAFKGEL